MYFRVPLRLREILKLTLPIPIGTDTPSRKELADRVERLEYQKEELTASLDRIASYYERTLDRAKRRDDDGADLQTRLATILLCYRDRWQQRLRIQISIRHYHEVLEAGSQTDKLNHELPVYTDRLVIEIKRWLDCQVNTYFDPADRPRRWRTSYHFPEKYYPWSNRERKRATSHAADLVHSVDAGNDMPDIETVIKEIYAEQIQEIESELPAIDEASYLGTCPVCGLSLLSADELLAYEQDSSEQVAWVECPDCDEVVQPI